MGMDKRSRAFFGMSYPNLTDEGMKDHLSAIRQLAEKISQYGHRVCGYFWIFCRRIRYCKRHFEISELRKVSVSSSGNHDHRMDNADWNEMWMEYPLAHHYVEQSNIIRSHQLQEKL
jgi:dipeptidyl-peptidase-4